MAQGNSKAKSVSYKDKEFKKNGLEEVYTQVMTDRETLLNESFKEWDSAFCLGYLNIASQAGTIEPLLKHYKFHDRLTEIYRNFIEGKNKIITAVQQLQEQTEKTENDVFNLASRIKATASAMEQSISTLDEVEFVKLPNIDNTKELKNAIIQKGDLAAKPGNIFENGEFQKIINTIDKTINHLHRIEQKSMASLLQKQDEIEKKWAKSLV